MEDNLCLVQVVAVTLCGDSKISEARCSADRRCARHLWMAMLLARLKRPVSWRKFALLKKCVMLKGMPIGALLAVVLGELLIAELMKDRRAELDLDGTIMEMNAITTLLAPMAVALVLRGAAATYLDLSANHQAIGARGCHGS